jgi:hypothetical protein
MRPCYTQTVVNGVVAPAFDLSMVNAADVLGFEYYTVAATPLKYNISGRGDEGAHCGTAVFWLK